MKEKNKILTGVSAMYDQSIISYSPAKKHYEMLFGTNTSTYNKSGKYKITVQKKDTFEIGAKYINEKYQYCPERLYIELDKYHLESTVKSEAIRNLEKLIDPYFVSKLYEKLIKQRRGIDKKRIENFFSRKLVNLKTLVQNSKDIKTLIKDYLLSLLSNADIPISIVKGGSSIELFTTINRQTIDIDIHSGRNNIEKILINLTTKNREIYFNVIDHDLSKIFTLIKNENSKKIIKLNFKPISKGGALKNDLKDVVIPVTFNMIYSQNDINQMIIDFKLKRKELKYLKGKTAITFSKEMLLAEKYQSIISKPLTTKRSKDLIDLKILWEKSTDYDLFRKWLFRKWEVSLKNPLNKQSVINYILDNKNIPLKKIESNFIDAAKMYDFKVSFEECKNIYDILSNEAIK